MYQGLQWQWDGQEAEQNAHLLDVLEMRCTRQTRRVVPDRMNLFIAMSEYEFVGTFLVKERISNLNHSRNST